MMELVFEKKVQRLKEKPLTASWLLGILVGVIIVGGGAWCSLTLKKVFDLEAGDTKRQVEITEIRAEQKMIRTEQSSQGNQLDRIEKKLDRISYGTRGRDSTWAPGSGFTNSLNNFGGESNANN